MGRVDEDPAFREHSAGVRMQLPSLKYLPELSPEHALLQSRVDPVRRLQRLESNDQVAEWKWYRGLRLPARPLLFQKRRNADEHFRSQVRASF